MWLEKVNVGTQSIFELGDSKSKILNEFVRVIYLLLGKPARNFGITFFEHQMFINKGTSRLKYLL